MKTKAPFNTILHGNCIEEMAKLPAQCIHLAVTDPPYITHYTARDGRFCRAAELAPHDPRAPGARAAQQWRSRSVAHDAQAYRAPEFQGVYSERWGAETFFDRYKNIWEVERFSGTSGAAVEQDIHGLFFLMTLESILTKPEQEALAQQGAARQSSSHK